MINSISRIGPTPSTPDISPPSPHRIDPFRKQEEENDPTRIRPGIHEPGKNDPTRIITLPSIPGVPEPV